MFSISLCVLWIIIPENPEARLGAALEIASEAPVRLQDRRNAAFYRVMPETLRRALRVALKVALRAPPSNICTEIGCSALG
jgi:hypothetical protein